MPARIYLDHNASTPLRPEARDAMLRVMAMPGNASSVHAEGRALAGEIETARRHVAALVGVPPANVFFTSGATEAANWALRGFGGLGRSLAIGATEHDCVRFGHGDAYERIQTIGVDENGLARALPDADVVALQLANSETGVVQPLSEIERPVGSVLVCDVVQACGRIPVDMNEFGIDVAIVSSHKIGGPHGVGALVVRDLSKMPKAQLIGGGHERFARAGTQNAAGIAGFGAAAKVALASRVSSKLRDSFERALRTVRPDVAFHGIEANRLPNTSCFSLPGVDPQTALMKLDLAGLAVSSGSACSSGRVARSHVLDAMFGRGSAPEGLRVSFGWSSADTDVHAAIDVFADAFQTDLRLGLGGLTPALGGLSDVQPHQTAVLGRLDNRQDDLIVEGN